MTKLEIARDEVKRLDAAIDSLMEERNLWQTIANRERTSAATPQSAALPASPPAETGEAYGSKTNALRRFLIGCPNGVSMRDLRAEAKKHSETQNFPYRFVDRMEEAGELRKQDGLLFATAKMQENLEG